MEWSDLRRRNPKILQSVRIEEDDFICSEPVTPDVWKHLQAYLSAIRQRQHRNQPVPSMCAWPGNDGPFFPLVAGANGIESINGAFTALAQASRCVEHPEQAEMWIWVAGWYENCPGGIQKHI